MNPSTNDKVDISRILINRVDGIASAARVTTLEAADHVLRAWVEDIAEETTCRCAVQIVFEDGGQLHSQLDFDKRHKRLSLARQVRKQLSALTATPKTGKKQEPAAPPVINLPGYRTAETAILALDNYNI